ncbi:MAG: peptidoglycan recognition protein family protein [Treponema sp.]|nr:peptidoglycan recognition protein family protein [Treponema sp.]
MILTHLFLSLGKMARGDTSNTKKQLFFTKPLEKIIIHWIGPYPSHTPLVVRNWWENGSDGRGVRASAHFIVKDENILQCLPLNEIGWHSGDARNHNSIGIEIIPMNIAGEFSQTSISTLKELIQHIRKEAGKFLELERHFDGVQKKDCPRFYTSITNLVGVEHRFLNPEGGQQRWEILKGFLDS